MAEENQDGQEKTEEPTQQRLQKAAEDGQLLTSKEMMVFTTLAAGLLLYLGLSPFFEIGLGAWARLFVIDSAENLNTLGLAKVRYGFWLVILATLIFGIPLMIVTVLTQAAIGGLNYSNKAYNFKSSKIRAGRAWQGSAEGGAAVLDRRIGDPATAAINHTFVA